MDGLLRLNFDRDGPSETAGALSLSPGKRRTLKREPGDRTQPAQMVAAPKMFFWGHHW